MAGEAVDELFAHGVDLGFDFLEEATLLVEAAGLVLDAVFDFAEGGCGL